MQVTYYKLLVIRISVDVMNYTRIKFASSMLSEFLEQFLPRIPSLMKHYNRSQSHDLKFMCSSDKNQHFLKEILFRNRSALIATTTRRERRQMFIASILITIIFIYAICHRWSSSSSSSSLGQSRPTGGKA